jgi:signal transduction histidine kinase
MAKTVKRRVRRWLIAAALVVVWLVVSLGWSWFLMSRAFERDMDARLVERARQIAEPIRQELAQEAAADAAHPLIHSGLLPVVQARLDEARRTDLDLAYAMVWNEEGDILANTRDFRLTRLDPDRWPALDPHQGWRVTRLSLPELGKTASTAPAVSRGAPRVIEATVPLMLRGKTIGYVSVAYGEQWYEEEFWRTQRGGVNLSVAWAVGGVVVLLVVLQLGKQRLDKRRRIMQQTGLARTSMLTERGMLASVLAHEVRSPLTALRFNLHSLRTLVSTRSSDVDRQVELTDRCEREIRRLDGMLNDFLQRTQVIGPVESASVNKVVREAMEFLRPALERNNIRVSIHLDESNPLVHVHPDELRQVILNLAANGQDAMSKGGGTLAVSTVAESAESGEGANGAAAVNLAGPTVTILIRDSGTGIPPELHQRIFEPFFSTKPNGSGLGLALVRRVVSGAGGTVFCESVVGEGTTFRIVLPRAEASVAPTVSAGHGYALVRRDEAALEIDQSPELVIDRSAERNDASSNDQ